MAITTTCSGCGKTLAVADEYAGRQARCPACGNIYTIPAASAPSTGTPAPILTPLSESVAASPDLSASNPSIPAPLDLGNPLSTANAPLNDNAASPVSDPLSSSASGSGTSAQHWMKASNGTEYGPVDSATIARWFSEGRVGQGYYIRVGEQGAWQPADIFHRSLNKPTPSSQAVNPFAASSTYAPGVATGRVYPKSDQSVLVLAMGILAWVGGCPIFGIIAWVVGAQALGDINAGLADPNSRGVTQVGYYLGMANVILCVGCGALMLLFIALSAI